ncbi:MAG: hypothetical protein ACAI44_28595 [Candidatus Sericytochromatia bacterium]
MLKLNPAHCALPVLLAMLLAPQLPVLAQTGATAPGADTEPARPAPGEGGDQQRQLQGQTVENDITRDNNDADPIGRDNRWLLISGLGLLFVWAGLKLMRRTRPVWD